jgi:subtilisin family serine protease
MKNLLFGLICLLSITVFSQTGQIIFKVEDATQIPVIDKDLKSTKLKIKSVDAKLTDTFGKYNLTEFRQLFPSSKRPELLKYYILETEDHKELLNELKKKHSDKFSKIYEFQESQSLYIPNDYGFCTMNGCDSLRNVGLSYLELINAPQAWEITQGNPNVIIGMIDNHLMVDHEDLAGKIFKVYDQNVRNSFSLNPDHGTMVAGILAANTNNNKGISSIGFNCRIAKTSINKNDLLLMAQEGIKVINISQDWGSANEADSLLISELTEDYKVTVVAAAGNTNCTKYTYPASYENVISVTSVGHEFTCGTTCNGRQFNWKDCHKKYLNIPENANYTHTHNDKVDICAPGYNMLTTCNPSTYINGLKEPSGQIYSIEDGTSFASPIVAGVCALMYSINPGLSPPEVKKILQTTAANIYAIPENAEYNGLLGAGRVDAFQAVKMAGTTRLTGLQSSKTISSGYGINLDHVTINLDSNLVLKVRKVVEISGIFDVPLGSRFEIQMDPLAVTLGQ